MALLLTDQVADDLCQNGQRNIEGELREQERFLRSTLNSLGTHICILDADGTIITVNTAWRTFAARNGLPRAPDAGTNYLRVCDAATGEDADTARAAAAGIRGVLGGERKVFELEYPCHSPDQERWFMMRVTPFDGEGPTRVVVSHENITARKVAERLASEQCALRQAVAGMEHMLGVVAHELRTPLAALRALSEFLCTDGARSTAEAERFLHDISDEVDRMSDTVNNLLEAARLNSGRARWNWSTFAVAEVVRDALDSVQPLIDSARINLIADLDPGLGCMRGDQDAIRRLLVNLLTNARKHTARGSIEIRARQHHTDGAQWLELTVSDTGCGIPPELFARIGEAFALNAGVVGGNHISGTGLGLAICKGIAAAHGGQLTIASVQQVGTSVAAHLRVDLDAAATGDTTHL